MRFQVKRNRQVLHHTLLFRIGRQTAPEQEKAVRPVGRAACLLLSRPFLLEDRQYQREYTDGDCKDDRQFLQFRLTARRLALGGERRRLTAERSAHAGAFRFLDQHDYDEQH
jgi:hypothetical protein